MDKKLKAKWLKALRSRKSKQGLGHLHFKEDGKADTLCCLGVLCQVAGIKSTALRTTDPETGVLGTLFMYDKSTGNLSERLRKKLGIKREDHAELVEMNDERYQKFYQIARWIERNL